MDFFAAQDDARERSGRLLWIFALAVVLTVLSVHLGVEFILSSGRSAAFHPHWDLLPWTAGATLLPMVIGAVVKWSSLSSGGGAVAEALGGRRIAPDSADFYEKRLLNIVEEVSIAAGLRVPEVWVLDDESGINAFAAGGDQSSAAVAVSRGCLEHLSRDELQGVIGHECSHILNGDMRLNFHMMAWIAGILVLSVLGQVFIRLAPYTSGTVSSGSSESRKKQEASSLPLLLLIGGFVLLIAGSVGAFFARWIQAAISRQREFLADASAVQFTRDPEGICNALKKIGGYAAGTQLQAARAKEVAHMLFCDGVSGFFSALFATHPPLPERIRRLDPNWQGEMLEAPVQAATEEFSDGLASGLTGAIERSQASELLNELGGEWMKLARSPKTSGQVILGMLEAFEDESKFDSPSGLASLTTVQRMMLLDLALSAARQLPQIQVHNLLQACERKVFSDGIYNLFEMMLLQSIRRHLGVASGLRSPAAVAYEDATSLHGAFQVVLSAMAALGADDELTRNAAFELGWSRLDLGPVHRMDLTEIPVVVIENALRECEQGTAALRGRLLESCVVVMEMDGVMTELEMAFLRATADAMGVSVPSFAKTS
jgi:Zn-dependent protease with chaperone function